MINFRFHLASLIAIFLALALGVVVGAGVIDRGVVDTLNSRLDSVEAKSDRISGENNQLRADNAKQGEYIKQVQCYAVDNRLLANNVVVVAVRGVDEEVVNNTVTEAKDCAGATVDGVLWLEGKWALNKDEDVKAMADLLGSGTRKPAALRAAAWKELAARLRGPSFSADTTSDLLATLESAGFVTLTPVGDGSRLPGDFPARGAAALLVVGSNGDVSDKDVVQPAASAFVEAGIPLVVGDDFEQVKDGPGRGTALSPVHDDDALSSKVSTVDDLDLSQGPATAVLALAGVLGDPPTVGQFGMTTGKLPDIS